MGQAALRPVLPVLVRIDGKPATVTGIGGVPSEIAGIMQITVQRPSSVQPGGYVPIVLQVGDSSTVSGAAWIAVSDDAH